MKQSPKKALSHGTFALQGHDPESTVFFKNIKIKILADDLAEGTNVAASEDSSKILSYQADHFALIDDHIHTGGAFSIDSAMKAFYRTGINLGLVIDVNTFEKGKENETLTTLLKKYEKLPVFLGVFRNNLVPLENVPESTLSKFDYVIGDVTSFENSKGQLVDILKNENIGDGEIFMEDYVKAITERLDKGGLDIWATASLLPESLAANYEKLWTTERMKKVTDAAKRNNVAIEVYHPRRVPSLAFLKLAKENGCLFTTGGMFRENKMEEPTYFYEAISQCKLDYKDIFIPGNAN